MLAERHAAQFTNDLGAPQRSLGNLMLVCNPTWAGGKGEGGFRTALYLMLLLIMGMRRIFSMHLNGPPVELPRVMMLLASGQSRG